ncbi:gamma-butyrolactone biosynthesis protein ScbA [Amycolatopsis ultiminotia]|uniref:Gamma-butyrolactone biosynthesis protein ScbA n=1 Tax=Amycolatopsis ultiminotia TaxID=543629 RepID=A0ABP6WA98_9PSEU
MPGACSVDFQRTIPRSLVHRAAVSEVFVTDLNIVSEGRFEVGAQWPRRHGFFGPRTRSTHDPLLYLETLRQAAILITHRAYGVPLSHSFISDSKTYALDADGLATEGSPVEVVLQGIAHDVTYRGKHLGGMRLEFGCFRDGVLIGTATEAGRIVSPAVYRRLRGDHFAATPFQARLLPTVDPQRVGRERREDVLLADTEVPGTWSLQSDPEHPVLFDHSVDHMPGMVLLEGARQAALLALGDPHALPVRAEFAFSAYLEFDAPCLVVAEELEPEPDGARVVRVVLEQNGRTAATGTLAMRLS